ncbi:MAG: putative lipid II flippase FtsW [Candidatus Omnitrophica bacterium]|nr:putative lipid II flippase FtsW [Candidatus Omnitrophota bacterium]
MFSKKKFLLYYNIYISGILLILFGTVFVLSSSFSYGLEKNNPIFYFEKHIIYLILGFIFFYLIQRLNMKKLEKYSFIIFVFTFLLSLLPIIQGGLRWARIGPISFQPSEFLKLSFIIYLSSFLKKKNWQVNNIKVLLIPLILWLIIMGILQLQKDLGTFIIITLVFISILFLCGLKMRYIFIFGSFLLLLIIGLILLFPYRIERIKGFFDKKKDVLGRDYQVEQSIISISSGGFFGKGLGAGIRKLRYVPEIHKDFVYAVVGEELGFVGAIGVLILFSIILFCGLEISKLCMDRFDKVISSGISILFGVQFLLHAGVVLRILPPKGTTLPFFSVGGSSLIVHLIAFGILLRICRDISVQKDIEEVIIHIK